MIAVSKLNKLKALVSNETPWFEAYTSDSSVTTRDYSVNQGRGLVPAVNGKSAGERGVNTCSKSLRAGQCGRPQSSRKSLYMVWENSAPEFKVKGKKQSVRDQLQLHGQHQQAAHSPIAPVVYGVGRQASGTAIKAEFDTAIMNANSVFKRRSEKVLQRAQKMEELIELHERHKYETNPLRKVLLRLKLVELAAAQGDSFEMVLKLLEQNGAAR